jgi:hypothetical protein
MNWLAKISSLDRVPPVCVRVSELSLDGWRVDIAAILRYPASADLGLCQPPPVLGSEQTISGSSASVRGPSSGYFFSRILGSLMDLGRKVRCWTKGSDREANVVGRRTTARVMCRDSICIQCQKSP